MRGRRCWLQARCEVVLRFAPPASVSDVAKAAALAADAFADSPPYVYALGASRVKRLRCLEGIFAAGFMLRLRHGCCHAAFAAAPLVASDSAARCVQETCGACSEAVEPAQLETVVCFYMLRSPEAVDPSLCELFSSGYVRRAVSCLGARAAWRLMWLTAWAEGIEQEVLAGRSAMRLEGMAVLLSWQRRGIGAQALRQALNEADRRGLEVVLATQEMRCVAFYRSLGFDVVREEEYTPGGFRTWFMLRAPAGSGPGGGEP